jgi:hypothetical protein
MVNRESIHLTDVLGGGCLVSMHKSRSKNTLSLSGLILNPDGLMSMIESSMYDKVDQQPIHDGIRLQAGLNRYPSEWIDALCQALDLTNARLKKEKLHAAAKHLLAPDTLSQVVAALRLPEQSALWDILKSGGWIKSGSLTRRYGDERSDSYFWSEQPPASTIGQLRLHGLLFVGYMLIGGRRWKVAVIPVELRNPLQKILSIGRS